MKTPMFSTPKQLAEIAAALRCYMRLPLSPKTIPGAYLEALIPSRPKATSDCSMNV